MKIFEIEDTNSDSILELIERDCQPWLKEFKYIQIFRGIVNEYDEFIKKTVRKDRKPLHTPLDFHNNINEYLQKKFGFHRGNPVFASIGDPGVDYGDSLYRIFPIGNFKYIFNTEVDDLYPFIEMMMDDLDSEDISDMMDFFHREVGKFYTDKNLRSAPAGHEVMIYCESYYGVLYDSDAFYLVDKQF